ncbi:Alpha carbonic anhydrase 5 [Oopsacas minuta]|uniref:Alpha carbonic anhydrase 5 n=1 Tax=Oopsacas minuta TaxID=111878 RepID=A0AAV7K024_9METZ|nr:Alpha carbonic anhydrase 5 [Oopsacas minuta]
MLCNDGTQQSPINIEMNDTVFNKGLNFETQIPEISHFNIVKSNNILTYELDIVGEYFPIINWVRVNEPSQYYDLNHIEFHWSCNDSKGSEHSIDNISGAAELQLHYYNPDHGGYDDAQVEDYGILVQTYILKLGNKLDLEIFKFGQAENSRMIELSGLISLTSDSKFFKYDGLVRNDPCSRMQWLVMAESIDITEEQLTELRLISSECNVRDQYERTENLVVSRNFEEYTQGSAGCLFKSNLFYALAQAWLSIHYIYI